MHMMFTTVLMYKILIYKPVSTMRVTCNVIFHIYLGIYLTKKVWFWLINHVLSYFLLTFPSFTCMKYSLTLPLFWKLHLYLRLCIAYVESILSELEHILLQKWSCLCCLFAAFYTSEKIKGSLVCISCIILTLMIISALLALIFFDNYTVYILSSVYTVVYVCVINYMWIVYDAW